MRSANDNTLPIDALMGAYLRFLRLAQGMSQDTLAQSITSDVAEVQRLERGSQRVSASILYRIGLALSLDPLEIIAGVKGAAAATRPKLKLVSSHS